MWALPQRQHVSVCKASVQNRVTVVNVSALGGAGVKTERGEGGKVSFWSLNWSKSCLFFRVFRFNFVFVLLWYVQLCGSPAKVSLVQIGCQLLPPQRVEGGEEGHFRGGGEAVFGLAPGTGLEGEGKKEEKTDPPCTGLLTFRIRVGIFCISQLSQWKDQNQRWIYPLSSPVCVPHSHRALLLSINY